MFSTINIKNLHLSFVIFFTFIFANTTSFGQVSVYNFGQSVSSYTPLTGGTTIAYSGAWDNHIAGAAAQASIPFSFSFDGVAYSQCFISPNGFITFGTTQPLPTNYIPISDNTTYNTITTGGAVSALGINLRAGSALSEIKYGIQGTAPNRVFVIEWVDAERVAELGNFDFQIRLAETTNVISFSYGLCQPQGSTDLITVQVGLRGPNNIFLQGNTINRLQGSSLVWLGSTLPGPQNVSSIKTNIFSYPNLGLEYTFTPAPTCVTPTAQPTNLIVGGTAITDVTITGNSFTAASPAPTKYLVLRHTISTPPTASIIQNRTYYQVGNPVGATTFKVLSAGPSLSFTQTGLLAPIPDTTYYYWVIPYNDLCTGGPFYNLSSLLTTSVTTCSRATTTSTPTVVGGNGFTANWAFVPGATNYFIDVSTDITFSTLVAGYSNLSVGTALSLNITGLLPATTYFFRVRAQGSNCLVNSNISSTTTTCGAYPVPFSQNFDSLAVGVLPQCAFRVDGNADSFQWQTQAVNFSSASRAIQIDKNPAAAMNDWFFLPAINVTAGLTYRLSFKYVTGTVATTTENLKVFYGTTQNVVGMSTNLLDMVGINNSVFLSRSVDFSPLSSGAIFIGFQGASAVNQTFIAIDDISVILAPRCTEPSNVVVSAITATTANVSWSAATPAPAQGYDYYFSTSNVAPNSATVPSGSVGAGITNVALLTLLPNTFYYVWVRGNCNAVDKSIWTSFQSFNTECVTPIISTTTPATRCGFGIATLNATPNITSTVYWYDTPTAGTVLGTGNSFTTPLISSSTTYYAEAKANGAQAIVGPTSPLEQGGILGVQNYQSFVTFTVSSATSLQSVDIYPMVSGQAGMIAIRNTSNVTLAQFPYTTNVSGGASLQQLTMNYPLSPGNYNLFFEILPASGLRMNVTSAVYPYPSSVATISGNGTDFGSNLGCYNWKFTTECISLRVPITATVTSPPALTLSTNATTICDGTTSGTITVSGYAVYNSLVWSPSTGISGNFASGFTFNPTTTTTYTLVANQSGGSLCGNTISIVVTVIPSPSLISILPNTASICLNDVQPLVGSTSAVTPTTIFSENFNGATNSWVVQNTSSGGSVTASQWTLRPNNYNYISPFWNVIFSSNDASQFYLTNADSQTSAPAPPGIVTRTTLTSPSINLTGYTSANLNFWHYIRYTESDSFLVQVSTNNGSTWTTIRTYTTIQGTALNFASATLSLNAYVGVPNLRIRYNFTSYWAYGWAIDNVSVTGTLATSLTWVPITGLFSDSAATIPYVANTALNTVYAKPNATVTYTATLTGANSCFTTTTATITVTPLSVGGVVSSNQYLCSGSTPANITLAGQVGSIVRWEYADNLAFTVNVTPIPNTTATLTSAQMGTFLTERYFRAVVKNGICNEAYSNVVFIAVQTTTWNGSSWSNGEPNASIKAIFNGNYNSATHLSIASTPNLNVCSVLVNSGVVVFAPNHSLVAVNEIVVAGGTLTFENNSSLVQVNDLAINTGNIFYKRNTTPIKKFDYTYWSTPVFPQTLLGVSPDTPSDKYFVYDQVVNYWVNVPSNNIMDLGRGYIMRAPYYYDLVATQIYNATFYGTPNNGVITIPIVVDLGVYNLIGNPYPSALNIDKFLSFPSNVSKVDATVYLWTHNTPITANQYTSNDYAAYNYLGGTGTSSAPNTGINNSYPTGKIASGQSFFIRGLADGNVTFNNWMRLSGNNSQFFRMDNPSVEPTSELEKHRFWLDVVSPQGVYKQILVGYAETATNDIDRGFDGEFLDVGNGVAIYSLCNGLKYNIQGKALPFTIDDEVPIGFKGNISGEYRISLHEFDGLFMNQDVFIKDAFLNTIHNLKVSPYLFQSETGIFDNRFTIVYKDGTLGNSDFETDDASIVLYKPNDKLSIDSGDKLMKNVKVFDIRGRLLTEKNAINATETEIELSTTNQVYLIQITTEDLKVVYKKYVN
jgi:hypothetical protein